MTAGNSEKIVRGRPFKPGQSGNPSGRPKIPEEVREAIRAACPAAVKKLIAFTEHPNPKIALNAITELLDRGYGKAAQQQEIQLDVSGELNLQSEIRRVLLERVNGNSGQGNSP